MGLAVLICTLVAEQLNKTRIGRRITRGCAWAVIAFAALVAILNTSLLVLAILGYD